MDLPVEKLSGGEQSRLRIAQLMLNPAQVLILDEPTNDLDVATLTVLEDSLKEFNGAVILVTHDRYFMDQVASQIMAFHRKPDGEVSIENFAGYLQWEEWFEEQKELEAQALKKEKKDLKASNKPVKLSFKEKYELENMEGTILELEEKLSALQTESGKPEVVSQADKIQDLYSQISEIQAQLEKLYARWAELEKKSQGSL